MNGKWYIAIDYLNRAMDNAIKINDKVLLGNAVYFILIIYINQGSFEKAKKTVEDALVHLDPGSLETFSALVFYAIALIAVYGVSLLFLAEVKHEMGLFQEAASLLEEAIREKKKGALSLRFPWPLTCRP
ncbi:MAG: hypothetical protein HW390_1198 [Candidatus Brocadiaceae bacterium]|nr:hypothetical protein [Candidatus Brocadiaceae bacterium]